MNLSQKIISICKTIQDENLFSAIDAGELHLCTKYQEFKKSDDFGKNQYWCKACKNLIMKKYNNELKLVDKLCECGRKINIRSYNTHLKSNYHKRRLYLLKENNFELVTEK